jgi:hypothetical protein
MRYQAKRIWFRTEGVKKTHACGKCTRKLQVGDTRLVISGYDTYPVHLCKKCALSLTGKIEKAFVSKALYLYF